jgi:hypothetical protein
VGRQQQVTLGVPGMLTPARQRRHAAGVDELQASQIDDDFRFPAATAASAAATPAAPAMSSSPRNATTT